MLREEEITVGVIIRRLFIVIFSGNVNLFMEISKAIDTIRFSFNQKANDDIVTVSFIFYTREFTWKPSKITVILAIVFFDVIFVLSNKLQWIYNILQSSPCVSGPVRESGHGALDK